MPSIVYRGTPASAVISRFGARVAFPKCHPSVNSLAFLGALKGSGTVDSSRRFTLVSFPALVSFMDLPQNRQPDDLISLDVSFPVWDRFFTVAPLVVIGTSERDGSYDMAPKHMVTPLGWENYFGFVCTPEHATYQNIQRDEVFTVSFPSADSVVLASLAASPRCGDDSKPALAALPSFPARTIDGRFLTQSSLFFECELDRIVDDFGSNSLIAGRIVSASIRPEAKRANDVDDQDVVAASPLLVYVSPGRYAVLDQSQAFPFPAGYQRSKDES